MTPLYIFNLDGTLSRIGPRARLLERRWCPRCGGAGYGEFLVTSCPECGGSGQLQPNAPAYYEASKHDEPNWPMVSLMNALIKSGADVWVWSERPSTLMNETLAWLQRFFEADEDEMQLFMRRDDDQRPEYQMKTDWLNSMSEYDRRRLVAVFDDGLNSVAMFRALDVPCLQSVPGGL